MPLGPRVTLGKQWFSSDTGAVEAHEARGEAARPVTAAGRVFAEAIAREADRVWVAVTETGGYTGSTIDAEPVVSGYVVNYLGPCPTLPLSASSDDIRLCLTANADWFTECGNRYFGLWQDIERKVLVLDRVTVTLALDAALTIAAERAQRAIYDLSSATPRRLSS